MAEVEFSVLSKQCLLRRLSSVKVVCRETAASCGTRNSIRAPIDLLTLATSSVRAEMPGSVAALPLGTQARL